MYRINDEVKSPDEIMYYLSILTSGVTITDVPLKLGDRNTAIKDGFIWIGSYSGLIRYDGNTFHRIDASDGVASVVCLFVDSKDREHPVEASSGLDPRPKYRRSKPEL